MITWLAWGQGGQCVCVCVCLPIAERLYIGSITETVPFFLLYLLAVKALSFNAFGMQLYGVPDRILPSIVVCTKRCNRQDMSVGRVRTPLSMHPSVTARTEPRSSDAPPPTAHVPYQRCYQQLQPHRQAVGRA